MNILYISSGRIKKLNEKSIYEDLINSLCKNGHNVSVVTTNEKSSGLKTSFKILDNVKLLNIKTGNLTKCSAIEKGITMLQIESQFIKAIKKYFGKDDYDLIIYNAPPVTLAKVIKFCKKKFSAKSYLIQHDIFPQNAVDLGMMKKSGLSGLMYKMFRKKEIALYKNSDRIGCMSNLNKQYLLEHNPYLKEEDIEIFPNALILRDKESVDKQLLESKGIDTSKVTFIYGGNLGVPQGLEFLCNGMKACEDLDCNFVVIGSGTQKADTFSKLANVKNAYTFDALPADEYSKFCASCDVGIISLDHRFTIPNYPSRTLSYMENAMPVLASTDKNTDIKKLVESEACFGKWSWSNDIDAFKQNVEWFIENKEHLQEMGDNGRAYFEKNFNAEICVEKLEKFLQKGE